MERRFNSAGPNNAELEYTIDPLKRLDLEEVLDLIDQRKYFVLQQTAAYMDLCGSVDEGHLIIFDRSQTKSWEERIWHRPYQQGSHTIMVWGM